MPKTPLRPLVLATALLLPTGVALPGPAEKKSDKEVVVQPRPLKLWAILHGRLVPETEEIKIPFKAYAGKATIRTVVPSGTAVKQGDVLLELDPVPGDDAVRDAALALEAAELAAKSARLALSALELKQRAELTRATLRAERAAEEKKLDAEQRWPIEQKDHELTIRRLKASIDDQEKELAELEKMYKASELASDTKEIVLERARRRLAITRDTLSQTRKQIALAVDVDHPRRVTDLANEKTWSAADLAWTKENQSVALAKSRNALAQAEQSLVKAKRHAAEIAVDRKAFRLTAPRAGVVVHGSAPARWKAGQATAPAPDAHLKADDAVKPGQVLFTLLAPGPGRIEVVVSVEHRLRVRKGAAVEAHIKALPGRVFKATVAEIADLPDGAANSVETFSARIALDAPPADLPPGLSAWVEIDLGEIPDALAVPVPAVAWKAGRATCRVRVGDAVEERRVVVGPGNGIELQVLEGLKAGDVVMKP